MSMILFLFFAFMFVITYDSFPKRNRSYFGEPPISTYYTTFPEKTQGITEKFTAESGVVPRHTVADSVSIQGQTQKYAVSFFYYTCYD